MSVKVHLDRFQKMEVICFCRDNILFGKSFQPERYEAVLQACALEADIEQMAEGDATLIGDRGTTLSGGQRARLSLARAIYQVGEFTANAHDTIANA